MKTCETCKWCHEDAVGGQGGVTICSLFCYFNAPVVGGRNNGSSMDSRPVTYKDNFCSKHEVTDD